MTWQKHDMSHVLVTDSQGENRRGCPGSFRVGPNPSLSGTATRKLRLRPHFVYYTSSDCNDLNTSSYIAYGHRQGNQSTIDDGFDNAN